MTKNETFTILRAARLIDGTGAQPVEDNPVVVIRHTQMIERGPSYTMIPRVHGQIIDVGPESAVEIPHGEVNEVILSNLTLVPGLIDSHVHLGLPADGRPYLKMMEDSDGVLLITAMKNAQHALNVGITTAKDCGARNRIIFDLRDAATRGLVQTPRLLISGRPITITGGHFWFCNGAVDGIDEIRKAIRQLFWEGADFIKLMSSGAAAYTPNAAHGISFSDEELTAAIEETHRYGRIITVHSEGIHAAEQSARVGVDTVEHGIAMVRPDGTRVYDPDVAKAIKESGAYVCPTIQTSYRHLLQLRAKNSLSPQEQKLRDTFEDKIEKKIEHFRRFHKLGIPFITGTDAGCGINKFGDIALGLELMVQGGMTPMETILATTKIPAEAINIDDKLGTIERGKFADIIAVPGNPLEDISMMQDVKLVMLDGKIVKQQLQ